MRVPLALPQGGASLRAGVCESAPWRFIGKIILQELLYVRVPLGATIGRTIPQELLCVRGPLGAATGRTVPLQKLQDHPCPPSLWLRPHMARAGSVHTPTPPALPGGCSSRVSAPSSPSSLLQGVCVSCSAVCVGSFTS